MKTDPVLSNPFLGYRLDPYEPGLIRRAKANQSTLQVVAQEQRNLTRLSREATQEGRVIVSKGIEYRSTVAGSYMGIAAGQTTVVSLEKIEEKTALPFNFAEKISENSPAMNVSEDQGIVESGQSSGDSIELALDPHLAQESMDELSREEQLVRAEIQSIHSKIDQADKGQKPEQDETEAGQAVQEKRKLDREIEEKKKELREISRAKLIKMQSELMTTLNQGFIQNSLAPLAMIKLAYGADSESPAQGSFG